VEPAPQRLPPGYRGSNRRTSGPHTVNINTIIVVIIILLLLIITVAIVSVSGIVIRGDRSVRRPPYCRVVITIIIIILILILIIITITTTLPASPSRPRRR
jgi:uncharacterized BrkB/YihY/UPF0761 family membrane protein